MSCDVPAEVLARWSALDARPARPFGTGLINRTFLVEGLHARYVLQRLHPVFAGSVNEDIDAVTAHLAGKGLPTPRLVRADDGAAWVDGPEGRPWRVLSYVEGASFERIDGLARAREAGRLVGRFHAALAGFAWEYRHVRAGVHDTPKHLANLSRALEEGGGHRLHGEVAPLARELFAAARDLPDLGALPTRHVHGDLKLSNLLFDAAGQGVCLVDLDTVGRLALAHELGDALRSWCNPAGEDAASARVDEAVLRAAVEGFAATGREVVAPAEVETIVAGLETICLELAARFLADALNESYFGWDARRFASRGEHNLLRGRGQLALAGSVRGARARLQEAVRAAFGG